MICPECKHDVNDQASVCDICGFELELYKQAYEKIYKEKLQRLNEFETMKNQPQVVYKTVSLPTQAVHQPRCPYCNSEDLTRITSVDKAVNIALFGLFGNKRKYQWHCNNCKTNW